MKLHLIKVRRARGSGPRLARVGVFHRPEVVLSGMGLRMETRGW